MSWAWQCDHSIDSATRPREVVRIKKEEPFCHLEIKGVEMKGVSGQLAEFQQDSVGRTRAPRSPEEQQVDKQYTLICVISLRALLS